MYIQVNLCQKLLFLHQLTRNVTTDCSLNSKFNTWKFQAQTWGEHVVYRNCFWHSEQFLYTTWSPMFCKKKSFWQRFTCTEPTRSFKGEPRVDRTYHLEPNKVRYIIKVYSYIFKYFGYFIFSYYIRPLCDQNWTKICGK